MDPSSVALQYPDAVRKEAVLARGFLCCVQTTCHAEASNLDDTGSVRSQQSSQRKSWSAGRDSANCGCLRCQAFAPPHTTSASAFSSK